MIREPNYTSRGRSTIIDSEDDLETAVDLLYEKVEQAWANGEKYYAQMRLIREVREDFGLGLREAKDLVDSMIEKYLQNINDMGIIYL